MSREVALLAECAACEHPNASTFERFLVTPWPLRPDPTLNFRMDMPPPARAGEAPSEDSDLSAREELEKAVDAYRTQVERAERAEAALADLLAAFSRMPDAGLTDDDPRWLWWHETTAARDKARSVLASSGPGDGTET